MLQDLSIDYDNVRRALHATTRRNSHYCPIYDLCCCLPPCCLPAAAAAAAAAVPSLAPCIDYRQLLAFSYTDVAAFTTGCELLLVE